MVTGTQAKENRCYTPKAARAERLRELMKLSNSPVTAPRSRKKKVRVSPKKTVAEAFTPISKKWVPEEQNLNSSQLMVNSDEEENSASKFELANQIDRMSKQLIQ